jgi:hypothetical protein
MQNTDADASPAGRHTPAMNGVAAKATSRNRPPALARHR